MDENAGGNSSPWRREALASGSGEDVINWFFLAFGSCEAFGLELEHGVITAALRHEFVVCAQLDDPAMFEHADAVGVSHSGKAVRDQNRRAMTRGGENALKDFGLPT